MSIHDVRRAGHSGSLVAALLHSDASLMVWFLLGALGLVDAKDLHLSAFQKGLMVPIAAGGVGGFPHPFGFGALASTTGTSPTGSAALALVGTGAGDAARRRGRVWHRSLELTGDLRMGTR
jgi:NNP family nitrate/nitrite transporter-like MFS transporter